MSQKGQVCCCFSIETWRRGSPLKTKCAGLQCYQTHLVIFNQAKWYFWPRNTSQDLVTVLMKLPTTRQLSGSKNSTPVIIKVRIKAEDLKQCVSCPFVSVKICYTVMLQCDKIPVTVLQQNLTKSLFLVFFMVVTRKCFKTDKRMWCQGQLTS